MKKQFAVMAAVFIVLLSNAAVFAAIGASSWVNPAWQDYIKKDDFAVQEKTIAILSTSTCNSEQAVVDLLKEKFSQRVTGFSFNMVYGFSFNEVGEIITRAKEAAVAGDDYLAVSVQAYEYGWSGYNGDVTVTYSVTYVSSAAQEQQVTTRVDEILGSIITAGMNDEQKEKAIHDWVVAHVAYDTSLQEHSAWAALFLGKTVCQGYSLLTCKMLQTVDVPVRYISSQSMNHAWNMVYLCGHWYHLDVTWDDPIPDVPGRIDYTYFNLSDAEISSGGNPHFGWSEDAPAAPVPYVEGVCAQASSLSVTPSSRNVARESGTTSFSVSNTGAGTMSWSAEVISGTGWLSIISGNSGSNTGSITCNFTPNSTTSSRTGTVRITATGAFGSPKNVTVTQAGTPAVTLTGLTINGPASVNENTTAAYTATAGWSDGTTTTVTPSWSENSAYTSINASGILAAVDVPGNQVITISASYSSAGVTKNATKSVTILNREDFVFQEGFEGDFLTTDYGSIPAGWYAYGATNIQFSRITSSFEGMYALRASGTFGDNCTYISKELTVPPGTRVNLAFQVRVGADAGPVWKTEMAIGFYEAGDDSWKSYGWDSDSGTYESKAATYTSPTGTFYLIICFCAGDGGGISTFDLDALTVTTVDNKVDGLSLFDPATSTFYMKNALSAGNADTSFSFGAKNAGWIPVAGDWDGDGNCGIGLFDPFTNTFFLKNSLSNGKADHTFRFGPKNAGWTPITGDWNGDGRCGFGLFDPSTNTFFLKNAFSNGKADETFRFGPKNAGWLPLTGDWNGDEQCGIGLYDPFTGTFFLKNAFSNGKADETFRFGPKNAGWIPVAGDWDGDGTDGFGLYNPGTSTFYLKNAFSNGNADVDFGFGPSGAGWIPLIGSW